MGNKSKNDGENRIAIRFMLTVGLATDIVLASMFMWISDRAREHVISEVHKQAKIAFEQVVITRHWNAA